MNASFTSQLTWIWRPFWDKVSESVTKFGYTVFEPYLGHYEFTTLQKPALKQRTLSDGTDRQRQN